MKTVFRLTKANRTELDGVGASIIGGRWNSTGNRVVYACEVLSLAVLEVLTTLQANEAPNYVWLHIELPKAASTSAQVANIESIQDCRAWGDNWLAEQKTLFAVVPSVLLPAGVEQNILINPAHPQMADVKVLGALPFHFDWRLYK